MNTQFIEDKANGHYGMVCEAQVAPLNENQWQAIASDLAQRVQQLANKVNELQAENFRLKQEKDLGGL